MNWSINLSVKPAIAQMGIGTHGERTAVDSYRLPTLWCVHLYRYHAVILVAGARLEVAPGSVTIFPPETTIEYHYRGKSIHAYAHFSLPAASRSAQRIPALQVAPGLRPSFEEAIGWLPGQRLRAEIRLWDILWQLATRTAASGHQHPAVSEALRLIELRLNEVPYVSDLARAVHLSQNHLTRLFTIATGKGVAAYIRDRRVERAVHLLRQSTLPVKAIAAEVGIPDLNLFNPQQIAGLVRRAARGLGSGALETERREVETVHERVEKAHGILGADVILQPLR